MSKREMPPGSADARAEARVAQEMTALSHPRRVAIFRVLSEAERGLSFEELLEETGLTTSTLSHHLRPMKAAGLVASRRAGPRISMRLASRAFGGGMRSVLAALETSAADRPAIGKA